MIELCDVLIVGGGGAALRAALAAIEFDPSLRVTLVTKGALGYSGVTATACSDRMAFHAALPTTEPGGEAPWRYHADDIYRIGGCVSDADLAQVLAEGGAAAFDYLDKLGVPWARRPDGAVDQFLTDGSEYPRACYTGPYTANHIEQALLRRLAQTPVRVIEHHMVGELLLDAPRQRVRGAVLVSQADGATRVLAAKAGVLATGGAGQAFEVNVYPDDCTGDGYALAYRAGAELVNLEFIQIGLCSLKTKLACSGSMMRALPRLVNDRDQEFLMGYMPQGTSYTRMYEILFAKGASWPVSQRDASHILDIAVAAELAAGRRVYLDYARDPQGLDLASFGQNIAGWYNEGKGVDLADKARVGTPLARLLAINQPSVDWLAERGVDLAVGDKIVIAPAVQHFQGGVKIRTKGDATIAGLYAAGEAAGGQHGANRPGGNALLDTQVFGRVAGENAARYARSQPGAMDEMDDDAPSLAALFAPDGAAAGEVRAQVRQAMALHCGVYRTQAGLSTLNALLDALARRSIRRGESLARDLEALNILQTARLVARAALERDESRGPHLRFADDGSLAPLPLDEGWQRYGVLWRGEQGPTWEAREPVRPLSAP